MLSTPQQKRLSLLVAGALFSIAAQAHGPVTPSSIDVTGLPPLTEWGTSNPYRTLGGETGDRIEYLGAYAYGQNCANCHGIEAKAGGIAPDLRLLAPVSDDEYYIGRVLNGGRGMPAFGTVLKPEAVWAIRTWLESKFEEAEAEYYGPK